MYGAILGDIIGSRFEFDRGGKTKEFDLFTQESTWTDDTVLTVAVADALMKEGPDADISKISGHVRHSLRKWGRKYPDAGYGGMFSRWLYADHPQPYGSYGNGSAMRVSAAGWLYNTLEKTREVARWTAEVTHNHSEGIKGAESVAVAIYLARNGKSKVEIKEYVEREFSYDLSRTVEGIKENYQFEVSCQKSVPESIIAFLEAEDFESAIRNAIWLGGDADTQADIARQTLKSDMEADSKLVDNL